LASGAPEVNAPAQSYAEEIMFFKDWIRRRIAWLDQNIPGNTGACEWLGTEENQSFETRVFPNPVEAELFIESDRPLQSIQLVDISGKQILNTKATSNSTVFMLHVAEIPSGMYLLLLTDEQGNQNISRLIIR
jgi:hypothetical protein